MHTHIHACIHTYTYIHACMHTYIYYKERASIPRGACPPGLFSGWGDFFRGGGGGDFSVGVGGGGGLLSLELFSEFYFWGVGGGGDFFLMPF